MREREGAGARELKSLCVCVREKGIKVLTVCGIIFHNQSISARINI